MGAAYSEHPPAVNAVLKTLQPLDTISVLGK
jgi:hypothetical protein